MVNNRKQHPPESLPIKGFAVLIRNPIKSVLPRPMISAVRT